MKINYSCILAHHRLALFPNSSFEFSRILHVGPTKSLTFSPGLSLRVAMVCIICTDPYIEWYGLVMVYYATGSSTSHSMGFGPGPPRTWDPLGPILFPHHCHVRIPKDMGIVWVPLTIRGSHYWESRVNHP